MKYLFIFAALLLTSVSYAGPEEHIQSQSCYFLDAASKTQAINLVPEQICFETLNIDPANQEIQVYSYFKQYQDLFNQMKVTSLIRNTEDTYKYAAEKVLVDEDGAGCGNLTKIVIKMSGLVDFMGYGDVSAQNLKVEQTLSNDVCHSYEETVLLNYVRY